MKTLLLVDASSYLYRAFHALPDLRTKAGEPILSSTSWKSISGSVHAA